jgi:hypothetical protein
MLLWHFPVKAGETSASGLGGGLEGRQGQRMRSMRLDEGSGETDASAKRAEAVTWPRTVDSEVTRLAPSTIKFSNLKGDQTRKNRCLLPLFLLETCPSHRMALHLAAMGSKNLCCGQQ